MRCRSGKARWGTTRQPVRIHDGLDPVAFGLWKGDLTLKRRLIEVIDDLETEGLTRDLSRRYRIAPIETTLRLN